MTDERDPVRDLLTRSVEPLPAPLGQYDRVRQRARQRRWRHAALPAVAAAVIAGTVTGVSVGAQSGSEREAPLVPAETPTPSALPTPTPTPTPTPLPSDLQTTPSKGSSSFTWNVHDAVTVGHPFAAALSCPTRTFCAAAAQLTTFDNSKPFGPEGLVVYENGAWSAPTPMPAFAGTFITVSCTDSSFCMAISKNGYYSRWEGSRWLPARQLAAAKRTLFIESLDCATPTFCMAAYPIESDPTTVATGYATWDGTGWSTLNTLSNIDITGFSCLTSTVCIGVGNTHDGTEAMTWNGTEWSSGETIAPGLGAITHVSCSTASSCMAVGGAHAAGDIYATWNGAHWSRVTRLATGLGSEGFASVSCPDVSLCIAADAGSGANFYPETFKGPLIAVWRNGTWSQLQEASDSSEATVSCADATYCIAVGGSGDKAAYLTGIVN